MEERPGRVLQLERQRRARTELIRRQLIQGARDHFEIVSFSFFKWLLSFQNLNTKLFGPNYLTKATDFSFERVSPGIIRKTAIN